MKHLSIIAAMLLASSSATGAVSGMRVIDLGQPVCAGQNREPSFIRGWFVNDLNGNEDAFLTPWADWPQFATSAKYSGLIQIGAENTVDWHFATPQNSINIVLGDPQPTTKFLFWNKGKTGPIIVGAGSGADVKNLGKTPGNDHYVSLSPKSGEVFEFFSIRLTGQQYSRMTYANFGVVCN